jgi:hypothetical protein
VVWKQADWKAGVHTPGLASVKFITTKKVVKPIFGSGYGPRQYNKFPLQRRYPGACSWVLHWKAGLVFAAVFCALAGCGVREAAADLEDPPIITSATYQHTLYTGKPQPIEARAAGEGPPPFVVTYFPSLEALERNEGGTAEPPSAVGSYYARIERPPGNGYARGRDIPVEYYIQKAFVNILAEEKQEALWDGLPKRARASAEPPVELTVTYYPYPGAGGPGAEGPLPLKEPPRDPGVYRAVISYPGDENYRDASREVEFSIVKR